MKPPKIKTSVRKIFNELFGNYPDLMQCREDIEAAYTLLVKCYKKKGKILLCGNGGSAADAEHIACELMKEFKLKREVTREDARKICRVDPENSEFLCEGLQRALPAISLVSQGALFSILGRTVLNPQRDPETGSWTSGPARATSPGSWLGVRVW